MALTKLTSNLIEGGTGTDWVTAIQTSNFTAAAGKGYFVNTTSQVLYVNLPVGVVGMEITIQDYAGTFATNKVILNANGSEKIQGSALEGKITTNNATAVLIYQDATKGWTSQDVELDITTISWATPTGQSLTYSTPSPQSSQGATAVTFPTTTFTATIAGSIINGTATIAGLPSGITAAQTITGSGVGNTLTVTLTGTFPSTNSLNTALTLSGLTITGPPLTVDYLVVAGGGSAGQAGGGGAGGYLTNLSGSISFNTATNYIVTVGAGGAGNTNSIGNDGNNSVFATITSTGGGGGAGQGAATANGFGRPGGSGGGAGINDAGNGGGGAASPAGQGNTGGGKGSGTIIGGGGGGAGAVGGNGTSSNGGAGGAGLTNTITGASAYYAGGGGGGAYPPGSVAAPGGSGGGGTGGKAPTQATSGTPNTGGGGGAAGLTSSGNLNGNSGSGGSGIVILRYPNTYSISGLSNTTTTVGSNKVTIFTTGTGNIQFN